MNVYMAAKEVKATPQTFIDRKRAGGYTDLKKYFGIELFGEG